MATKKVQKAFNYEKELLRLGAQLRERRGELGVNATVTAESAGISRVTLYRIERGEPSVAIGAYMSVIQALGLKFEVINPLFRQEHSHRTKKLPSKIRIGDYQQLKRIAWQLKETQEIPLQDALSLYERNWRHLDFKKMNENEKRFIKSLLTKYGKERPLV